MFIKTKKVRNEIADKFLRIAFQSGFTFLFLSGFCLIKIVLCSSDPVLGTFEEEFLY